MFKKKFKVRVNCGTGDYRLIGQRCCVEYTHHWFFPEWITINNWLTHAKTVQTFRAQAKDCEIFAKTFNSIEDIRDWEEELKKNTYEHDHTYITKIIINK